MSNKPKRDKNAKLKTDLKRWCDNASDQFHRDLGIAVINERKRLQKKVNNAIDRPVPFTQRAVNSTSRQIKPYTSIHKLFIMDKQDEYLKHYFDGAHGIEKFVPLSGDRTNQFGNIRFLANNGSNKRYIAKKTKYGVLLIDPKVTEKTRGKKKGKQVVAIMKKTDRKGILGSWDKNTDDIVGGINKRIKKRVNELKFI